MRDWAAYDRALARRGDITVWVSPDAIDGWRAPAGRRTFSDAAIAAALTVRAVYRLALRQAEGLVASIFALLGLALPVPDHTTLSRRGRTLRLDRRTDAGRGVDLAIDSTGLRVARPPGAGRGGWRKLHIAVDPDSGRILAEELTRSGVHDARPVPAMLGRIAGRLGRVYGDGAYSGGPTHRAVAERRQALPNAEGVFRPRAPAVRAAARLDPLSARGRHARHVAREGRGAWERATGYGRRNAAEWTFSRFKRVLGGALRSRGTETRRAEAALAACALNRMAGSACRKHAASRDQRPARRSTTLGQVMHQSPYRHGQRVSEAVRLRRDELDLDRARLWVHRLKGGLSVEQPIAGDELRAIRRYLATRTDALPWLFVSERGQPLTRQAVNYLVAAAAERAGLAGVHPHTLRHSCGFALADKGHDLRLIQDYLGHRDPRHTVHYTRTAGGRFEGLWGR